MEELPKKEEFIAGAEEFPEDHKRRRNIRTMQKDMEMLLRQKYGEELPREPLPKEEKAPKKIIPPAPSPPKKKFEAPRPTLPSPSKAHPVHPGLILFLVIFAIIIGGIVFGYYKFYVELPSPPEDSQPSPLLPPTPSIVAPDSLIPVKETIKLSLEQKQDLTRAIQKRLEIEYEPSIFTRILAREKQKDEFFTLPEFLDALKVTIPSRILGSLEDNFTFFVYGQDGGDKIGFVAKFNPEEDYPMLEHRVRYWEMRHWENAMERDLNTLLFLLGREKEVAGPEFLDETHKGVEIRYLPFGETNITLQYALIPKDDLLVITTSSESMHAVIDLFVSQEPKDETANWHIYRNEAYGYEVKYPNTWYFYDKGYYIGGSAETCAGGHFETPRKEVFFSSRKYINCIPLGMEVPFEFKILVREPREITCESDEFYSASYMMLKGDIEVCRKITIKQRWAYEGETADWGYGTYIEFNRGERGYFIEYVNQDKRGVHDPLYDKLLSTFKLIE